MVDVTISAIRNASPDDAVTGREILALDDGLSGTTKASVLGDTSLGVSGTTILDYILKYILAATFNIGNTVVAATKKLTLGTALTAGYFLNIKLDATNTKGIEVHDGVNALFSVEVDGKAVLPAIQSRTLVAPLAKNSNNVEIGFFNRAWALIKPATAANQAATYQRVGTTVTVSLNAHGYLAGHRVYADFTSGGAVDGEFTITSVATNTFTFTHGTSGDIAAGSTMNLNRIAIEASGGIHSISTSAAAQNFIMNYLVAMPDAKYGTYGTGGESTNGKYVETDTLATRTAYSTKFGFLDPGVAWHTPNFASVAAIR